MSCPLYLDSSALVKLVQEEAETEALRRFLARASAQYSSVLAAPRVPRAADAAICAHPHAHLLLDEVDPVEIDEAPHRRGQGRRREPADPGAIHLATASPLGDELDAVVTSRHPPGRSRGGRRPPCRVSALTPQAESSPHQNGLWRSLVSASVWGPKVPGSNPGSPTTATQGPVMAPGRPGTCDDDAVNVGAPELMIILFVLLVVVVPLVLVLWFATRATQAAARARRGWPCRGRRPWSAPPAQRRRAVVRRPDRALRPTLVGRRALDRRRGPRQRPAERRPGVAADPPRRPRLTVALGRRRRP